MSCAAFVSVNRKRRTTRSDGDEILLLHVLITHSVKEPSFSRFDFDRLQFKFEIEHLPFGTSSS